MAGKTDLQTRIERLLRSGHEFGTLSGFARKLQQLCRSPSSSPRELARIVACDPVLTARLLRTANSSSYSFPSKIETIEQGVVVIGQDAVQELSSDVPVLNPDRVDRIGAHFDIAGFWRHSLDTALACRAIQMHVKGTGGPELFVAGLLANIGRIILMEVFPNAFVTVLKIAAERGISLLETERIVLRVTHAEIGYWAARVWHMSDALCLAIRTHHAPGDNEWAKVVSLAYVIAHAMGDGSPGDSAVCRLAPDLMESLGLDEFAISGLLREIDREYQIAGAASGSMYLL